MAEDGAPLRRQRKERGNRIFVFWVEVGFLAVLAVLAWAYFTPAAPSWLRAPAAFGMLPSGVLWFGALGGVLISLAGVHDHRYDWDQRYWTWHLIRPVVGAAVGTVAVIIVMAGILAVGVDPTPATSADGAGATEGQTLLDTKNLFYFLVAFMVGYREMHFRDLVKRLGDVLFTSKDESKPGRILGVDPAKGPAAGGTLVKINGNGFDGTSAVKFGAQDAEFQTISDAQIEATTPAGDPGPVAVTVVTSAGTATGGSFTFE
jgi:hypothetical protein